MLGNHHEQAFSERRRHPGIADERVIAAAHPQIVNAELRDQCAVERARQRGAAGMEVVDTGPVIREWIDAIRQRVSVNRDQHVGVVELGKMRTGVELDRRGIGTGQ